MIGTTTPLQKVAYQCREWPNSLYCSQIAFAPGAQYDHLAWTRLGLCDNSGTTVQTNAPTPTKPPTNAPITAKPTQTPTNSPTPPTWGATLDIWTDITGDAISDLMVGSNNLTFPAISSNLPGSVLEVRTNYINEDNIGVRMRGWLVPPITGYYKFWIASDGKGELWLSSNGNPANKGKICEARTASVGLRQWDIYPEQTSVNIPLVAGEAYYYEVCFSTPSGCLCCCLHDCILME